MDLTKLTFAEKRVILDKIPPDTPYCYAYVNEKWYCCPYWESVSHDKRGFTSKAKCNLLGIRDKYAQDSDTLLWDQVKICGLKRGF